MRPTPRATWPLWPRPVAAMSLRAKVERSTGDIGDSDYRPIWVSSLERALFVRRNARRRAFLSTASAFSEKELGACQRGNETARSPLTIVESQLRTVPPNNMSRVVAPASEMPHHPGKCERGERRFYISSPSARVCKAAVSHRHQLHPKVDNAPRVEHLPHYKALWAVASPPSASAHTKVPPAVPPRRMVDVARIVGRVDVSAEVEDVHTRRREQPKEADAHDL